MILAAGRGERLRPLTDRTPKPLLEVGGATLIERHLRALAVAGIRRVVINTSHLGDQLARMLGTGEQFGVEIRFCHESPGALETAGGVVNALTLLNSDPFLVVNADVWTEFEFAGVPRAIDTQAHLILVDNPEHHPHGDFRIHGGRVLPLDAEYGEPLTFSGIGIYHHALFAALDPGPRPLAPVLNAAARRGQVSGEHYAGGWVDVGTPERLASLRRRLGESP